MTTLYEDGAHAGVAGVGFDGERLGEIRQREHWYLDHGLLELVERLLCALVPMESLLGQQLGEGLGEDAVVGDELAVVPREPEESAQLRGCGWYRPGVHCTGLLRVGGDPVLGDHMAQVVNARLSK